MILLYLYTIFFTQITIFSCVVDKLSRVRPPTGEVTVDILNKHKKFLLKIQSDIKEKETKYFLIINYDILNHKIKNLNFWKMRVIRLVLKSYHLFLYILFLFQLGKAKFLKEYLHRKASKLGKIGPKWDKSVTF